MPSLFLALALTAWPVPADAGSDAWASPVNWPAEPGWADAWPLLSYVPADWPLAARDAGVGMSVDRAWSHTRGVPTITIAVVSDGVNLSDPIVAGAFRLNAAEAPDAGDLNGNGRLDVGDFANDPRVVDVNGNGALDLEDVAQALADGVDQDQNGRVDDLCGWDLARNAPLRSRGDAGLGPWRTLAAPVNDDREGIGVCPGCTLVPFVAAVTADGLFAAADAGARIVLVTRSEAETSLRLLAALDAGLIVITEGSGELTTFPLALERAVLSPRTLTAPADRSTATSRGGCGGSALGTHSVPTTGCAPEAAATLAGLAGLVLSLSPDATGDQVSGLLGGARVDALHAVAWAEEGLPPTNGPAPRGVPSLSAPGSAASQCAIDRGPGEEQVSCDAGASLASTATGTLDADPRGAISWFLEREGPYQWSTPFPAPPTATLRWLLGVTALGPGSGPPRYVDLDGLDSDSVLAGTPFGLRGLTTAVEALSPPLPAGRWPLLIGAVDADRTLDVVALGDDGELDAFSLAGPRLQGYPETLAARPAGPPVLVPTVGGAALVTLDVEGHLVHRVGAARWSTDLGAPQHSAPAAGRIDGDDFADFAVADGTTLRVLLTGEGGPTASSWSVGCRASDALLADLTGTAELEIVAERVFSAHGTQLLSLENWSPSVVPPVLTRLDHSTLRSLVQVEGRADGAFELTRYDVELALRSNDSLALRRVLRVLRHRPARGGFAVADVTGDRSPDVLLPTEDGLLFVVDGLGESPPESPLPTWGTVLTAPAVGVRAHQLEFSVRTTRGDLVRFLGTGLVEDITWESAGHDRGNTRNAETPLPARRLRGLGIDQPPRLSPGCGCAALDLPLGALLVFLFRRRRGTC